MELVNRATSQLERYIRPQGLKILSLIGLAYVASKSLGAVSSFFRTFVHFGKNLPQRYGTGSWAVITGGANGIGAAFAGELAAKGFNIVLIDVDETNLALTATKIITQFPTVLVKTIICDFSKVWQEGYLNFLDKEIEGLDISILINNVGRGCGVGPLHRTVEKQVIDTVAVNLLTMTLLTRKFIPNMLKRTQRSAIINIASVTGLYPWPNLSSVYGATKAYVDILSRSVSEEVGDKIDVISVRPSEVSTALIRHLSLNAYTIAPLSVATSVLKKLGSVTTTSGHWRHEIMAGIRQIGFLRRYSWNNFLNRVVHQRAQAEIAAVPKVTA